MIIRKVFNNNVLLASDEQGCQFVLLGRGIGFQAAAGQRVDASRVQQTFVASSARDGDERMSAMLREIPPQHVSIAAELLGIAVQRLAIRPAAGVIIALADHLSFAVSRARDGVAVAAPLRAEVEHLYPREFQLGLEALDLVRERTGCPLAEEEAVSIALHLVNAQFSGEDASGAFRMTELLRQIFDVIEASYERAFDTRSLSAARFITHLRYFFVRVESAAQLEEPGHPLSDAIRSSFPEAHACAQRIGMLLEIRLGTPVTQDEITYLTMHVARLAADEAGLASPPGEDR